MRFLCGCTSDIDGAAPLSEEIFRTFETIALDEEGFLCTGRRGLPGLPRSPSAPVWLAHSSLFGRLDAPRCESLMDSGRVRTLAVLGRVSNFSGGELVVVYKGRNINPVVFWDRYVEFGNLKFSADDAFSPKVQCPNPNHDTVKRHFQINLQEPKVHCFAYCGISGSWEHAIAMIDGIYEKLGVDLENVQRAYDKHPTARSVYEREQIRLHAKAKRQARKLIFREAAGHAQISGDASVRYSRPGNSRSTSVVRSELLAYESYLPPVAKEYLDARGITGESIALWNIGWHSEDRRIVIPAHDENAHLKFLIKRAIRAKDQPKYLYTEGVPKTSILFGVDKTDLGMITSSGLILVEGSLDVVWMHQLGFKNVVAILGTGISDEQVRIVARMRPRKLFLMFDKDSAGVMNIQICADKLRKYPMYVVKYPRGKSDPAELTKREAVRQIDRSVPLVKFIQSTSLSVRKRRGKDIEYVADNKR